MCSSDLSRKKEEGEENQAAVENVQEEVIPANISNEGHADTSVNAEEAKIAAEQTAFAASMDNAPVEEAPASTPSATPAEEKTYFETTDDGQVRSHFVNN